MATHDMAICYIWQRDDWTKWTYHLSEINDLLNQAHYQQGLLNGRMYDLGMDLRQQAGLETLTENIVQSSAIEGENLNVHSVRSSLARKLGIEIGAVSPVDRHIEGVVEMMLDATTYYNVALTNERLFGWHAALFPTGYSGLSKITVAAFRQDEQGAMQVVSGRFGHETVHYQAPPAAILNDEMTLFLRWFNQDNQEDGFIKAAIAHLWFLTLHPFEDGNGRIARALGDMLLAKADNSAQRFYSLSAQIQNKRSHYYDILEQTQKGTNNITPWLKWFLQTLIEAMQSAHKSIEKILFKAKFWQYNQHITINERQRKVLNRLLDGFEGRLNNRKWVAITDCSRDTALRDINDLIEKGILYKAESGGRSVFYELITEKSTNNY